MASMVRPRAEGSGITTALPLKMRSSPDARPMPPHASAPSVEPARGRAPRPYRASWLAGGIVGALLATTPVFIVIISYLFLRQRFALATVLGVAVGVVGVAVLLGAGG